MSQGQQTDNFEFLFSFDPEAVVGADIYDGDILLEAYAPTPAGGGTVVGMQSNGNGKYDLISISPGWHVKVYVDEDGDGEFTYVESLNVTGPIMIEFLENGGASQDARGHQIIFDPVDSGTPDIAFVKYAIGNYNYVGDENNDAIIDLNGNGQIADLGDIYL
ncbi:hypothetical protein [Mangrovicoccus sp. HB161399]|uniref:hypothetical protein n=1 Tax=Mangrovicoccus sp. HB161399 TaxID=2720392 RepID=UPI00155459F5|nr:hypothetical protein [Mangrovicoccus sp. HB161399]